MQRMQERWDGQYFIKSTFYIFTQASTCLSKFIRELYKGRFFRLLTNIFISKISFNAHLTVSTRFYLIKQLLNSSLSEQHEQWCRVAGYTTWQLSHYYTPYELLCEVFIKRYDSLSSDSVQSLLFISLTLPFYRIRTSCFEDRSFGFIIFD